MNEKGDERVLGLLNIQPDRYYTLSGKSLIKLDKDFKEENEKIKKQALIIKILKEQQKNIKWRISNEI